MSTPKQATERNCTLMNTKEVSKKLGISERFLRMMVVRDSFPSPLRIGRLTKWPTYVVDDWIMEKR